MTFLTNGYWNSKYFAESYWHDDYWQDSGAMGEFILLALSHNHPFNIASSHGFPLNIVLSGVAQ